MRHRVCVTGPKAADRVKGHRPGLSDRDVESSMVIERAGNIDWMEMVVVAA